MQLATPLSHMGNIKADTVKYLLTVREPGQSGGALRRGYRSLVGSFSGSFCSKRQKSVGRCLIVDERKARLKASEEPGKAQVCAAQRRRVLKMRAG